MNIKNKYILALTTAALLTACSDQLDLKPANTIDAGTAVSTSKDVEALMVGAYTALGDGDLYGGNLLRDAELLGDDGEIFWDGTFVDPGEIWTKSMLITNGQAELTWLAAYQAINSANTVLTNLNVVTPDKVERIEGEAKFVRAVCYFELVRAYARTWTDGNPATNPGVPIVTEPNTLELLDRSSVQAVYALVIQDLTDAKALLPESNSFFATTYAASAMLSRVYMMQNDYAKAAAEANIVIESGEFELLDSYADNFNNSSAGEGNATSEDVFSAQVTNQAGVNNMVTFFASSDFAGRGDIYIEPAHFDMYEAGDERLDLFYDGERTGKWTNQFGSVNIIRLAEMYLNRAEANFREGTAVGATPLDDINTIRERVGLDPLGALTIDDILVERHLELAFEGHLIHDIKRTQRSVGALPYNAPKLIYPIPNRERILNPAMAQNEGYGAQ